MGKQERVLVKDVQCVIWAANHSRRFRARVSFDEAP